MARARLAIKEGARTDRAAFSIMTHFETLQVGGVF